MVQLHVPDGFMAVSIHRYDIINDISFKPSLVVDDNVVKSILLQVLRDEKRLIVINGENAHFSGKRWKHRVAAQLPRRKIVPSWEKHRLATLRTCSAKVI